MFRDIIKRYSEKNVETHKNHPDQLDLRDLSELILKQFNEIPIPNNLLDPFLFKPFVDPVITPYGHVYSNQTIMRHLNEANVDPITRQPLTRGQLHQAPQEIIAILTKLEKLQSATKKSIVEDPKSASTIFETYRSHLILLDIDMEVILKKQIIQGTIRMIKNNLKIDATNKDHIAFWQHKGKSGKNIPDHVHNMMKVAKENYDFVEDFLDAVNDERRLSASSKFFKHCFRSNVTLDLYNQSDENIRSFVVRD